MVCMWACFTALLMFAGTANAWPVTLLPTKTVIVLGAAGENSPPFQIAGTKGWQVSPIELRGYEGIGRALTRVIAEPWRVVASTPAGARSYNARKINLYDDGKIYRNAGFAIRLARTYAASFAWDNVTSKYLPTAMVLVVTPPEDCTFAKDYDGGDCITTMLANTAGVVNDARAKGLAVIVQEMPDRSNIDRSYASMHSQELYGKVLPPFITDQQYDCVRMAWNNAFSGNGVHMIDLYAGVDPEASTIDGLRFKPEVMEDKMKMLAMLITNVSPKAANPNRLSFPYKTPTFSESELVD